MSLNLDKMTTETRNPSTMELDTMTPLEVVTAMNREDANVPAAIQPILPQIARVVEWAIQSVEAGGRVFYLGAGTSGRLGVLDAAESPPTCGVSDEVLSGRSAGGARRPRGAGRAGGAGGSLSTSGARRSRGAGRTSGAGGTGGRGHLSATLRAGGSGKVKFDLDMPPPVDINPPDQLHQKPPGQPVHVSARQKSGQLRAAAHQGGGRLLGPNKVHRRPELSGPRLTPGLDPAVPLPVDLAPSPVHIEAVQHSRHPLQLPGPLRQQGIQAL